MRVFVCALVCLWACVFVSIDRLIVCVRVCLCVRVFVCLSVCFSVCLRVYMCVRACSLFVYILVDTHFCQFGLSCTDILHVIYPANLDDRYVDLEYKNSPGQLVELPPYTVL